MEHEFSIGENLMRRVSKKELIEMINQTFLEEYGTIAVITETKARLDFENKVVKMQTVTFGKPLEG